MSNKVLYSVGMEGFKCFDALNVELGQLTVLSGYNGAGKSTLLQSILLFAQAMRKYEITGVSSIWPLNGDLVNLGKSGEVIRDKSIKFDYKLNGQNIPESFEFDTEPSSRNLRLLKSSRDIDDKLFQKVAQTQYISAMRGGTSDTYPLLDDPDYSKNGVGIDGRYAGHWFEIFSSGRIDGERVFEKDESKDFREQVNSWLDFVAPGTSANVEKIEKASLLALQFQLSELGEWHSPANVGFGISYVFPIIVALLSAKEGDCVIIDSPEAHLHPRAQSRVGMMITKFAQAGVQVLVETHSDHILNGVRIATKKGYIDPVDVGLLFFSGVTENESGVVSTEIDKNGNIEYWPPGFFDQMDSDIVELLSDG